MAKITMSKDGLPRMNLKVTARISLYDLATLLMIKFLYEVPKEDEDIDTVRQHKKKSEKFLKAKLKALSNKQILAMVQEVVLNDGLENPSYTVGDSGLGDAADILASLLAKRFRGFTRTNS